MKVAFIVLTLKKDNGEAEAEAELEEIVAKKLSHVKYWKLEKYSVIEI